MVSASQKKIFQFSVKKNTDMANYATSVLAKGQAVVSAKNQAPEQRKKTPTVFELAIKNQEFSIPHAQELRKSPLRPVEINFLTNVLPGAGTAKAYNHNGTYGDTGKVELVYVTHVETLGIPRKIADNSIMEYQNMFNNLYEQKWKNLRTRHDNSALAFLFANRAQLAANVMNPQIASANPGAWNAANFALEISQTDKNMFLQRAKAFMAARYHTGELDLIADLQIAQYIEFLQNQGAGNYVNTAFQTMGISPVVTQDQIAPAYANGAALVMPKGSLAGLNWNEALNKRGVNGGDTSSIGILGTTLDPLGSGAIADISMYTQRADTSANTYGGSPQDIVDQWEIALTIGYALPPLSAAGDSVVHLVAQS
jgi:hypothetical protein